MLQNRVITAVKASIEKYPHYIFPPPLISFAVFMLLYFSHIVTSVDSARYLLSTLVQSEAAAIAIVVTLSLVAVQQAASSYSQKVIRKFRKSPSLWALTILFISSMIYTLIILKMVQPTFFIVLAESNADPNLEWHIRLCLSLGVLCFATLAFYIRRVLIKFETPRVIQELSRDITRTEFRREDPVQPIMELAQKSIRKHDFRITKECLDTVKKRMSILFEEEDLEEEEETEISMTVRKHFSTMGRLAINEEDRDSASEVISIIKEMGMITVEKGFKRASKEFVLSLEEMGMAAIEKVYENISLEAASCLNEIGIRAAERGLEEVIWNVILSLRRIGMSAIRGDVSE